MAKISTFEAGYCLHISCMALRGSGWRICKFPARAYLLEAAGKRWVWDTGYARHFQHYTQSGIFQLYRRITPVYFDEQQALVHQLAAEGIQPRDLQGLIISHYHGDHIAGLRDFAGVPFISSGIAWQKTQPLRGFAALKQAFVPGLLPADFAERLQFMESFPETTLPAELAPFERAYALPGSQGEILLVELPGHAAGHIGAFVLGEAGWTLLASDAAWSPLSYQQLRGPSRLANLVMDSSRAYYQTLERLNQLYRGGKVQIRLSHEGDI